MIDSLRRAESTAAKKRRLVRSVIGCVLVCMVVGLLMKLIPVPVRKVPTPPEVPRGQLLDSWAMTVALGSTPSFPVYQAGSPKEVLGSVVSVIESQDKQEPGTLGAELTRHCTKRLEDSRIDNLLRAAALLVTGDFPEAAIVSMTARNDALAQVPPIHPIAADALVIGAGAAEFQGQYERAAALLAEALRYDKALPDGELRLASCLYRAGKFQESLPVWQSLLDRCEADKAPPGATAFHCRMGCAMTLRKLGKVDEAKKLAEKALAEGLPAYGEDDPGIAANRRLLEELKSP